MADLKNPELLDSVTPEDVAVKNPEFLTGDYPLSVSKDIKILALISSENNIREVLEFYNTRRKVSVDVGEEFDTQRDILALLNVEDNFDTSRRVLQEVSFSIPTRRRLLPPDRAEQTYSYNTYRKVTKDIEVSFDTYRYDSSFDESFSFDTQRNVILPYGIFQCKQIDLGFEQNVIIGVSIDGDGYALIKDVDGEYREFTMKEITTQIIDVIIHVNDSIRSAKLYIIHPVKSKVVKAKVAKEGSTISYGMVFRHPPAIFPSLSPYEIKLIEQTNTDVTLQLFKDGEPVEGDITFEVKGR